MAKQTEQLLEEIRKAANLLYLSDLLSKKFDSRTVEFVSQIPDDQYTIDEWNMSISYIFGKKYNCKSVQEAKKEFSLSHLEKNKKCVII